MTVATNGSRAAPSRPSPLDLSATLLLFDRLPLRVLHLVEVLTSFVRVDAQALSKKPPYQTCVGDTRGVAHVQFSTNASSAMPVKYDFRALVRPVLKMQF